MPFLAFLQMIRAIALASAVIWLVAGPGDVIRAALAPALESAFAAGGVYVVAVPVRYGESA